MVLLPQVVRARYDKAYCILVMFNDGTEASVDFEPWLEGPIFEPLKRLSYFRKFFVEGGTVAWPNGADIAPETLYEVAAETRSNLALQPTAASNHRRRG
jgi:hypothetical protein